MKIDTANYREDHGHLPQGCDPAPWAFDIVTSWGMTTIYAPGPMKLAEAKRWALSEARQIGGVEFIQLAS